jgi:ribosome-associated protein
MIEINDGLSIPDEELRFTPSRSSGPGGQHVNKVSTRMTLHFDVGASPSLDERQRRRIATVLSTRINRDGILKLRTGIHRSQTANRRELIERFASLLHDALRPRTPRKRTRRPARSNAKRLEEKKRRGRLKQNRSGRFDD